MEQDDVFQDINEILKNCDDDFMKKIEEELANTDYWPSNEDEKIKVESSPLPQLSPPFNGGNPLVSQYSHTIKVPTPSLSPTKNPLISTEPQKIHQPIAVTTIPSVTQNAHKTGHTPSRSPNVQRPFYVNLAPANTQQHSESNGSVIHLDNQPIQPNKTQLHTQPFIIQNNSKGITPVILQTNDASFSPVILQPNIINPEGQTFMYTAVQGIKPNIITAKTSPTILTTNIPVVVGDKKRSSHNAIERRYRTSINDKLDILKNLLAGNDQKLSKSIILQKAIEHIKYLRNQNSRLKEELKAIKLKYHMGSVKDTSFNEAYTPPHSDISSPYHSPHAFDSDSISSPESKMEEKYSKIVIGMSDNSRLTLCAFMIGLIIFNPFSLLLDNVTSQSSTNDFSTRLDQRRILSDDLNSTVANSWALWLFNVFFIHMINFVILGGCLVKMMTHFSIALAFQDNISNARLELHRALAVCGKSVQAGGRGHAKFFTLAAAILRQVLQRLPFVGWLSRRAGDLWSDSPVRKATQRWAVEVASVSHCLTQLEVLSSHSGRSERVLLALQAINIAETSENRLLLADTYVTAALVFKEYMPKIGNWLCGFYLRRCRMILSDSCTLLPVRLRWVISPRGQAFLRTRRWSYERVHPPSALFCRLPNVVDPLAYAMRAYHLDLLQKSLQMLLCADERNNTHTVLKLIKLITDDVSPDAEKHTGCWDPFMEWWANLVGVAAAWLLADPTASQFANRVNDLPKTLAIAEDPLPRALHMAYKSRRHMLRLAECRNERSVRDTCEAVLKACDEAGATLAESLTYYCCKKPTQLMMLMQVLCCDWLLEVRAGVWEARNGSKASEVQLRGFHQDLHSLRRLSQYMPWVTSRVLLQSAVYRMMAGAAPKRTQQLLDGSLRPRFNRSSIICGKDRALERGGGEGERAVALYMACKHLPNEMLAAPGERAGMLTQAANMLSKLGHRGRQLHCFHLLKSLGSLPSAP
ncbi:hypothetical protein ACJJTC_011740 [Scirpophaga incertulas]